MTRPSLRNRKKEALPNAVGNPSAVDSHRFGEVSFGSDHDQSCDICRNKKKFVIHHSLLEEFRRGNVVIFAGAGISTENKDVIPYTLFEEICRLVKLNPESTSFPAAMQAFADQPNGRLDLVTKIRDRFDYVDSFPELRRNATRFHNELATLYTVDTIVTTNWDTYFERHCSAQPFVVPSDFPFWNASPRRVLKIHGTQLGLKAVHTDATFFVESIKDHLQQDTHFISDSVYAEAAEFLDVVESAHDKLYESFNCFDDPEIVLCGSYQDGLIHALERVLNLRSSGVYSHRCYVENMVRNYDEFRSRKLQSKRYADVAYIEGYQNGLIYVATHGQRSNRTVPPLFFLYSRPMLQIPNWSSFKRALSDVRDNKRHHVGAYNEAVRATAHLGEDEARTIVIHHKCQLL